MRRLSLLVAMLAVLATARADTMGMFFDPNNYDEESAAVNTSPGQPFYGYVVLLDASPSTIGGYELGITFSSSSVSTLGVTGPNGWTNFGDSTNHLVGYITPLPASSGGVVLCTMNLMQLDSDRVDIEFGPSSPSSVSGMPAVAEGTEPFAVIGCELFTGGPVVAQLNAPPHQYQEVPLSRVKALFE